MSSLWTSEEELLALARRELYSAVIGDIMDTLGLLNQFLPPRIQPLDAGMVVAGRAMTVIEADCLESEGELSRNPVLRRPFGLMLEALDDLTPNEVYLATGGSPTFALWGELMSTRAMKLGAAGAVVDGYSRDTKGILGLGFPTFSHGRYAQDQTPRGKVIDFRVPLQMGRVRVNPGDIVFGDMDGVCVVPAEAAEEVFTGALEKARGEKRVAEAIRGGMSAREAFDTFGIL